MLGKRIMAAREKRGLSRTQVAEGMGVSESLVGRWERGERRPTTKSLPKLAQLLGVPVGTLLAAEASPSVQDLHPECRICDTDPVADILETVRVLRAYPEMDLLVRQLSECKDPTTVRKIVRVVTALLEEDQR